MNKLNIAQIPSQTGCYLLKDQDQKVIYVGKAKNLKQRIKQHFKNNQKNKFLNLIHD
jgi:excinuclease UvrABC nuclease subunit